jgi:hypothetical protein
MTTAKAKAQSEGASRYLERQAKSERDAGDWVIVSETALNMVRCWLRLVANSSPT